MPRLSAACVALALLLAAPALADRPAAARQEMLRHIVRQDCGSCHGMTLNGGLGSPLLPQTLDGVAAESLADIILNGIPGTPMPPWAGLLDADDARWIAVELKKGFPP
ncbi:cytochrome c [Skermanella rosea]|uniref:c-type cytochrome n=1 Tax=Skermanella rosea TaxID=1817965 RepID=UPI0019330ADA|nr:cytochrome c [Skermanella rosea]UEM06337.1 cytochrome c [Skermanella rosea]